MRCRCPEFSSWRQRRVQSLFHCTCHRHFQVTKDVQFIKYRLTTDTEKSFNSAQCLVPTGDLPTKSYLFLFNSDSQSFNLTLFIFFILFYSSEGLLCLYLGVWQYLVEVAPSCTVSDELDLSLLVSQVLLLVEFVCQSLQFSQGQLQWKPVAVRLWSIFQHVLNNNSQSNQLLSLTYMWVWVSEWVRLYLYSTFYSCFTMRSLGFSSL